jgi:hypothetical protein
MKFPVLTARRTGHSDRDGKQDEKTQFRKELRFCFCCGWVMTLSRRKAPPQPDQKM